MNAERSGNGYSGNVDFLTGGAIEFHWAERDVDTGFKMKQFVNPMGERSLLLPHGRRQGLHAPL